ncbi:hypothetical protein [Streptomyces iconiensis]|uniref:Uncharacterized protein n=1 Tax=Streptomyces iconiensis TaxID=1384038 RepID=A0ABT7AB16_9ACTN|nr:hypothetical protein [Streptomyces iconiensis]MDJ1138532.1 hypothetical protein [Streptomyces iconiensis]
MCTINHAAFAKPGYLIDTPCQSMAPAGALFTRLLAHHAELGLTGEQVTGLLDVSREYHDKQVALRLEFARVTEQLEVKWGRVDAEFVNLRKDLIAQHAELFATDEALFFEYGERGHALLSDRQIDAAEAIYHREKDAGLTALTPSLNSAVGPAFTFTACQEAAAA